MVVFLKIIKENKIKKNFKKIREFLGHLQKCVLRLRH